MITFLIVFGIIGLILTGACVFFGIVGLALKFVFTVLDLIFSWKVLAWFVLFWIVLTLFFKPKNEKKEKKS